MIIEAQNVCVKFRTGWRKHIAALDHFSLEVAEGDIFGLLGPNGAGKSTAMHCFLGLMQPNAGRISVCGAQPSLGAPLFDDILYLPEEPHYHLYLNVREAVEYYAQLHRRPIPRASILGAIDRVGLAEHQGLRLSKCSKGMKQKVGLAVCMLFRPKVLFLDEPTRGLDPVMVRDFRNYMLDISREGTTIVLNSHVLSEVELVCNRVAIVHRGRAVAQGAMKDLVRMNEDLYEVVMDPVTEVPSFLLDARQVAGTLFARVARERLGELVSFIQQQGVRMQSCRLQRETLEDVYLRIMQEGRP